MKDDELTEAVNTFNEVINAFEGRLAAFVRNTHGSVAIVGASIISENLRRALRSRMRPLSNALERRLFEGYGPLSSLSSRIDLAFALGIVSTQIRDDLNVVRTIRNTFAHSKEIRDFTDPGIAEQCKRLRTWNPRKTDLRVVYTESLKAIVDYLDEVVRNTQPREGKAR